MSTFPGKVEPLAVDVTVTSDALQVTLADGREIAVPLGVVRLRDAAPRQRSSWQLIDGGIGLHWLEIDEDISVESLLATR